MNLRPFACFAVLSVFSISWASADEVVLKPIGSGLKGGVERIAGKPGGAVVGTAGGGLLISKASPVWGGRLRTLVDVSAKGLVQVGGSDDGRFVLGFRQDSRASGGGGILSDYGVGPYVAGGVESQYEADTLRGSRADFRALAEGGLMGGPASGGIVGVAAVLGVQAAGLDGSGPQYDGSTVVGGRVKLLGLDKIYASGDILRSTSGTKYSGIRLQVDGRLSDHLAVSVDAAKESIGDRLKKDTEDENVRVGETKATRYGLSLTGNF